MRARKRPDLGTGQPGACDGTVVMSNNLSATLDARVAELDRMISAQLSAVMHAPEFQKLEQQLDRPALPGRQLRHRHEPADPHAQRHQARTGEGLPVRAGVRPEHACSRRSTKKNSAPSAARRSARCWATSRSRASRKTCISSSRCRTSPPPRTRRSSPRPRPELFGLESYGDLGKPRDLAKVFDTVEYAKWKAFRESEDARYVGLTLPRFLGRLPFNPGRWHHRRRLQLRRGSRRQRPSQIPVV